MTGSHISMERTRACVGRVGVTQLASKAQPILSDQLPTFLLSTSGRKDLVFPTSAPHKRRWVPDLPLNGQGGQKLWTGRLQRERGHGPETSDGSSICLCH